MTTARTLALIFSPLTTYCLAQETRPVPFPARPYVVMNVQELAHLRAALAQPGWKAELYRMPRKATAANLGYGTRWNADLWLRREIEIPARGGHYHHFFCDDGDRLEMPTDQRFVPGPYRCPKCGRSYEGPRYEGALRRTAHIWLAQAAWDLAMVSAIEAKPEYATKAAEILLKYADAYPGPHTNATTGGILYQSLCEAMWIIPLAQAYDLIHDALTATQRETIEAFLRTAAEGIGRCGTGGNWGSWHLSAVGVVGYAIQAPDLIDWATSHFKQQIRDQLGDDGLWPESVHTYHFFPLRAFVAFAEAAWHTGTDLYHWEGKPGKSLMSMFTAPLHYGYPDLRLPAINDGWFQAFLPPDFYELAYHRERTPAFASVLANGYRPEAVPAGFATRDDAPPRSGLYAFLFGDTVPANAPPLPATSVNFPVLGICILRSTNGSMMTFDYGRFLGHGQLDKMGITLYANDTLWAADYGTPGYGSKILPWYKSTFSHNTIVVDNQSQNRTKENDADLWLGDADLEAARSRTAEAYEGVTYTRTVVRVHEYFVIVDELTSETSHTYDFYLHAEGELALTDDAAAGVTIEPPCPWITDLRAAAPRETVEARWRKGETGLALVMTGGAITPIRGLCPAESGSRTIPILIARQSGKTATFHTVLMPFTKTVHLSVTALPNAVEIRHGTTLDHLNLPPGGKPTLARKRLDTANE